MNLPSKKSELLARVSSTRTALLGNLNGLARVLDVPDRIRSSFHSHALAWVGGAVALGMASAMLLRKGGKSLSQWRPMVLGVLGTLGNRALATSLPALREIVETEWSRRMDRRRPAESKGSQMPH